METNKIAVKIIIIKANMPTISIFIKINTSFVISISDLYVPLPYFLILLYTEFTYKYISLYTFLDCISAIFSSTSLALVSFISLYPSSLKACTLAVFNS